MTFDPKKSSLYKEAVDRAEAAMAVARTIQSIDNQDSADRANEILGLTSDVRKEIEEHRKSATRERREEVTVTDKAFKEILNPIQAVEQALKKSLIQFNREEEERVAEEQAKLEEETATQQEKEDEKAAEEDREPEEISAPELAPAPTTRRGSTGTSTPRKERKYCIVDFTKLPDDYKLPNKGELHRATKSGIDKIPGVEFYYEDNLAVRR